MVVVEVPPGSELRNLLDAIDVAEAALETAHARIAEADMELVRLDEAEVAIAAGEYDDPDYDVVGRRRATRQQRETAVEEVERQTLIVRGLRSRLPAAEEKFASACAELDRLAGLLASTSARRDETLNRLAARIRAALKEARTVERIRAEQDELEKAIAELAAAVGAASVIRTDEPDWCPDGIGEIDAAVRRLTPNADAERAAAHRASQARERDEHRAHEVGQILANYGEDPEYGAGRNLAQLPEPLQVKAREFAAAIKAART